MSEKRRYARASIQPALAQTMSLLGASIGWPNLETSNLIDLSYKGAAAGRPGLFTVEQNMKISAELRLGLSEPFHAQARVAWLSLDSVGLEMTEISPEGHKAMKEFLDAKLLGAEMKPVDRALYSASEDFSHWFQNHSGTHIFVWLNRSGRIDKVHVDFGQSPVEFVRETPPPEYTPEEARALLVLSQMDKVGLPMEEFLRTLAPGG